MRSISLAILMSLPTVTVAQSITVTGGKSDAVNIVVRAQIPKEKKNHNVFSDDGNGGYAHMATPGLLKPTDKDNYFTFLLPELKANESKTISTNYDPGPMSADLATKMAYRFQVEKDKHIDLVKDGKKLIRFVNAPHDEKNHYLTFKPFHHVFDPDDGETLLTSGALASTPENLFPHHRGIFYGFNKISYGNKQTADIWHGTKNVYSQCDKILEEVEWNYAFGRHCVAISWHGEDGKTFADEQRELTVFKAEKGMMIDWISILSTKLPTVRLDGDPQHAGVHFRATQEVSKSTAKQTYYLRPDGKGKLGETRNWESNPKEVNAIRKDPRTINLPWDAMSFVTGGKRHTVLRMVHPDNPKESRGSERDYGRFGDYIEWDLTLKTPLKVQYRFWVQSGEMTVEQCRVMYEGFANRPQIQVTN